MSAVTVNPSTPAHDGAFNHLVIATQTHRPNPPKDALFSNLAIGENRAFGTPVKDLNVTHLAVTQTIAGTPVAPVNYSIGHV